MAFDSMAALEQRRLLSVSAHIRILNDEATIQAGQSVHVSALAAGKSAGTRFGSGDAITSQIQWDFHDKGSAYNRLPGFNAAHVYEKPGTYKVTLRVTNAAGEVGTASRVIKVTPAHRKTIYVNPWGKDSNNGATPDTAVATFGRASHLAGDDTAIYFRAGQNFNVDNALSLPFSNVLIGAYGNGKSPRLLLKSNASQYASIFDMGAASKHVTIENLFLGTSGKSAKGEMIHVKGSNIVIKGCQFGNVDSAIMEYDGSTGVMVYNNLAGTTGSYFAFVRGSDQAFLGNIAGDSTKQHNIRMYASRILAYGNDLTNLPKGTSLATLRVNDGSDIYWSNNVLHGGQMYVGPLGPKSAGSKASQGVDTVVIENNRWQEIAGNWSSHPRLELDAGSANVMVRNNFIQASNSVAFNTVTSLHQKFSDGTVDRKIRNLQIISNTVVNNGTSGAFLSVGGGEKSALTLKDSLYVAPDLKIGVNAAAAVRVQDRDDLLNFTMLSSGGGIDGNVWNLPSGARSMGVNYVGSRPLGATAYRTPSEWEKDFPSQVGKDSFQRVFARQLNSLGDLV